MLNRETSFTANQSALHTTLLHDSHPRKTQSDIMVTDDSRVKKEENAMGKVSITEKEMHSHVIIREILQRSCEKTVKHDINRVPPHLQLYKKGNNHHHSACNASFSETSQAKMSQRVKSIYKQLQEQTPLWRKIERAAQLKNKQYTKPSRQVSASGTKTISIAGLTTYNFHSVKARYRLAFDPQGTDQEVNTSVRATKAKSQCSISRSEKIHFKTCPNEAATDASLTQAITHNYGEMTTQQYLKSIHSQKENNQFIYGQRFKSVSKISKLMALEESSQQTAEFTIEQIKICRPASKVMMNMGRNGHKRARMNGDAAFQGRRLPAKQSKIIIRNILPE